MTRPASAGPGPTPRPCEQLYSVRRCLAMADEATAFSEKTRDDVDSVVILPDPTPEIGPDGEVILQTLGGAAPIRVRLLMRDGTTLDAQMCTGIPSGPACADEPQPWDTTGNLIGGGYHDVPCAGEPPDGCPTPIPSIDAGVVPDATPIKVPSVMIPIDRVGGYEVTLGKGSLPNGIVTQATYRLADPWPMDVTFSAEGAPRLEIRSLEPDGRPFQNAYEHGWRDGLERIEAVLVFEVRRFDPGASLEVVEVVVR
jgi:hypothetical protein